MQLPSCILLLKQRSAAVRSATVVSVLTTQGTKEQFSPPHKNKFLAIRQQTKVTLQMLLQKFITMDHPASRDEKLNEALTFFSSFHSTASFHVDPATSIAVGSFGPTPLRSNMPTAESSVSQQESCFSVFQEEMEADSLWSLLREDIIEIKGKSTLLR